MSEKSHQEVQEQVVPGVTPGAILQAMEDPDAFAQLARGDLYVQMAKMRAVANNPETPFNHRLEYSKFLAKMGKVEQPSTEESVLANIPMINIDLGDRGSVQIGPAAGPKPLPSSAGNSARDSAGDGDSDSGPAKPSSAVIP